VVIETLDGEEELAVAPGTQTGTVVRLRQRGVPVVEGRGRGDLLVTLVVDTPTELSPVEEDLLRRLAEERGDEVAPPGQGLLSRLRSAFK
jgi:molecular chaperone DnaJ